MEDEVKSWQRELVPVRLYVNRYILWPFRLGKLVDDLDKIAKLVFR